MTTTPMTDTSLGNSGSKVDETKDAATRGASEVADSVKGQASSLVESSKEQGAEVARDAMQHAQHLALQTRDELRSQAQQQMQSLAQTVQAIADQLDGLANGDPQPGMVLDVANQLASNAHRLGEHLDQGGMEAVVGDVKQFARRRPGAFLAASLFGGIVAGRMLRGTDVRGLAQSAKEAVSSGSGSNGSSGPTDQSAQGSPATQTSAPIASGYPAPLPEPQLESPGATGYPGMSE